MSLTYEGGEMRNKWIRDELKEQALILFPSATFIDGKPENNFKVQVNFEKLDAADRKKYLGSKAENPQKLCGCIPKTKAIKPIHDEISNNENEHFSDVIAPRSWIVQPTEPSPQKQFLDRFFSIHGPFIPFILLFYHLFRISLFYLYYFIEKIFILPLSILTGINPTPVPGGIFDLFRLPLQEGL